MKPTRSKAMARKFARGVASSGALASASPVAALRISLRLPRRKFARLLGRTERAIIDWETGKANLQGLSQQRVRELERLTGALQELFDPTILGEWFDTPNPGLGNLKPIEVIERGESDRLWQMIFEIRSGSHV